VESLSAAIEEAEVIAITVESRGGGGQASSESNKIGKHCDL
jgi:hypothetical protein